MILAIFGKEFIIVNEELVIYFSFFVVLNILVRNFGKQLSDQFSENANNLVQGLRSGFQDKLNSLLVYLTANFKQKNFITYLVNFETSSLLLVFKLKEYLGKAMIAQRTRIK